jgi:hypothetical protein
MRALVVAICFLLLAGCNRNTARILPPDKMEAVLWDIIRADVFTQNFVKKDSLRNPVMENLKLQDQVFTKHQVTKTDFYKSYDYYINHSDLMKIILDSMSAKAERDRPNMMRRHTGAELK